MQAVKLLQQNPHFTIINDQLLLLLLPFYSFYTRQPALAGTRVKNWRTGKKLWGKVAQVSTGQVSDATDSVEVL